MKGYHFTRADGRLGYGDGRVVKEGHNLTVKVDWRSRKAYWNVDLQWPKCCSYGLHASPRVIDALQYAPGCRLWLVDVPVIGKQRDKFVGASRTALKDYGDLLWAMPLFAKWCAARAVARVADAARAAARVTNAVARAADAADAARATNATNAARTATDAIYTRVV